MKKLLSSLIILFTGAMVFAASLRDYVCVVRPEISEKTTAFLTDYKDYLETKGYKTYASNVEAYLKGSFGSGFIIYGSNNKPYILTNRHVVLEAETATVQFENGDGSTSDYKNLKIVACDEDIDIALIALPDEFKKPGLSLSYSKVNDGDDVWSAGFPGLGTDPVWQLGKGIVSNSSARIKELLDPSISSLIQHSAQIDAGNSGGPLMVANSKASSGYSVVGINTWKAVYRENTNFAIPSSVIKSFMDKAISGKGKVDIKERLNQFTKTVGNKDASFSDMARFISNDMVSTCGGELFIKVLQRASINVRNTIINAFAYDPIEGLRYTLAYYVYSSFYDDENLVDYKVSDPEASGDFYKVNYVPADKEEIPSIWMEEQGNWKLKDFNKLAVKDDTANTSKTKKNGKKDTKKEYGSSTVFIEDPYPLNFSVGYSLPKDGCKGGYLIDFSYVYQYFGVSVFLMNETIKLRIEDSWGNYEKTEATSMTTYGVGVRAQLPINCTYVIIEPYAEGKYGFSNFTKIHENTNRFYFGYGAGVDIIINAFSDDFAPEIGVKYLHSSYKTNKSDRIAFNAGIKIGM